MDVVKTITVDGEVFAAVMAKAITDTAQNVYGIVGIHNVVFQAVAAKAAGAAWRMLCELAEENRLTETDDRMNNGKWRRECEKQYEINSGADDHE